MTSDYIDNYIQVLDKRIRRIAREEANKAIVNALGYRIIDGKLYKEIDISVDKGTKI